MKSRLQTILNLENLSAAQLASILGIQRSTLSNLLSGRNNPSYEILISLQKNLPNLNIEWLLNGSGQPFKEMGKNLRGQSDIMTDKTSAENIANDTTEDETYDNISDVVDEDLPAAEPDLFTPQPQPPVSEPTPEPTPKPVIPAPEPTPEPITREPETPEPPTVEKSASKTLRRVILCFSDNTFESYVI